MRRNVGMGMGMGANIRGRNRLKCRDIRGLVLGYVLILYACTCGL